MNQYVTLAEKQGGEVGGEAAEKAEKQNKSQWNQSDKGGEAGGEAAEKHPHSRKGNGKKRGGLEDRSRCQEKMKDLM